MLHEVHDGKTSQIRGSNTKNKYNYENNTDGKTSQIRGSNTVYSKLYCMSKEERQIMDKM